MGGIFLPEEKDYVNEKVKCAQQQDDTNFLSESERKERQIMIANRDNFYKEQKISFSLKLWKVVNMVKCQTPEIVMFRAGILEFKCFTSKPTFNGIEFTLLVHGKA